ncbi:MAG: hypothetical protein HYU28_04735 [Actinobacteria bacterium]|nr:hypothetical protein [Actinomycetota bacterium]
MRAWARRGAGLVVGIVLVGGPAAAAENQVDDKGGDAVDCEASDTLPDRTAGDVTSVKVSEGGDEGRILIEVTVAEDIEAIIQGQFSWAILVRKVEADGSERQFLLEIHDGARREGEVDPASGEIVPSGVEVDVEGRTVIFDVDQTLAATKTIQGAAFNTPAEGDPKSCDVSPTITVKADAGEAGEPEAEPAPAPQPPKDAPDEPLVDEADEGGFPVGIVIALIVAGGGLVGLLLWWRRRPGDPEVPILVGDFCDWAAYWEADGKRTVLREPAGHECCVYVLSLTMTVERAAFAVQGRQDDPAVEGPGGRLRIPLNHLNGSGLDVWGKAGARNGPSGALEWMQGLGDAPGREAAGEDRPPGRGEISDADNRSGVEPFDEPFDPSSSIDWQELHVLRARLESECPDHRHRYACEGLSDVDILPGHECTNADPGNACPVQAPAVGRASVGLEGGLQYFQQVEAGHLPQQPSDHEHPNRPRQEAATRGTGRDARPVDGDSLQIDIRNEVVIGAGTRVPASAWATTDRVTAEIEAYVEHNISVDAKMQRSSACDAGACCGRECRCDPAFKLDLVNGVGKLVVDGRTWRVDLDPTPPRRPGASAPWTVE